jgi:hypothetical protein
MAYLAIRNTAAAAAIAPATAVSLIPSVDELDMVISSGCPDIDARSRTRHQPE